MKRFILGFAILSSLIFTSCSEKLDNSFFDHVIEVEVPNGYKLTYATLEGAGMNIRYMCEEMDSTYIPKTKCLIETSPFGKVMKTVVFKESK